MSEMSSMESERLSPEAKRMKYTRAVDKLSCEVMRMKEARAIHCSIS